MKNKNPMEMFQSVEDQVIKNTEPLFGSDHTSGLTAK